MRGAERGSSRPLRSAEHRAGPRKFGICEDGGVWGRRGKAEGEDRSGVSAGCVLPAGHFPTPR